MDGVEAVCIGQTIPPLRAPYSMGLLFAGQFLVEHRNSARVLLSMLFCLRALYNPNFKASARCFAFPPSISLMSSGTEVLLSAFSPAARCFHPITMISGCLLFSLGVWLRTEAEDSMRTELLNSKMSQPQCSLLRASSRCLSMLVH